jgi:HAD superfamily hydrolase (TIGR01509 family)
MRWIAFDVDGTLIDTDAVHEIALNEALESVAGFRLSHEEHLSTWKGLPTAQKLAQLVAAGRLAPSQVAEVAARKQAATLPAIATVPVSRDPARLLAALRAEGWGIVAVSNAIRPTVDAMLRHSETAPYIAYVFTPADGRPKPFPDLYVWAAARCGIETPRLIVVEDGAPGRLAATRAGCRLIAVDGPQDVTRELLWPRIQANVTMMEATCT